MKIPKMFVSKCKSLERKTKELLKKPVETYSHTTIETLLKTCEEFTSLHKSSNDNIASRYDTGRSLAQEVTYTKLDIEELCKRITFQNDQDAYLGFYLSALINKIITEKDHIILKPKLKLSGLGVYLPTGNVTIYHDLLDFTGSYQTGGELRVEGSTRSDTGYGKAGGSIVVEGDAGGHAASYMAGGTVWAKRMGELACYHMAGGMAVSDGAVGREAGYCMTPEGELWVYGKIEHIATNCKGKIYLKNKKIWPAV